MPPDHDEYDHGVAHEAPDHAEDVDTQVESELRHSGPGVRHGLGSVVANCDEYCLLLCNSQKSGKFNFSL